MTYAEIVNRLSTLGMDQVKPGLERMQDACARLNHPESSFKCVHVAGTNGKGSTIAFLESILRDNNYTVGKYTSPHLHDLRERITTNGNMISENEFVSAYEEVNTKCTDMALSYFEWLTLIMFVQFRTHPVDIVLLETGLGGLWDATNVVLPLLSVIATIDYDHQAFLGETLTLIAGEKCGILKPNVPAVSAVQFSEVMDVIQEAVSDLGIHAQIVPPVSVEIPLGLAGNHQRQNAALAVAAARSLSAQGFPIRDFFEPLATATWPGRLEWISQDPPILCDVAHNPSGMQTLVDFFRVRSTIATGGAERGPHFRQQAVPRAQIRQAAAKGDADKWGASVTGPVAIVLGVMRDKDATGMVKTLSEIADTFYCVTPHTPRALPAEEVAQIVRATGKTAIVSTITDMKRTWKGPGILIVTGSFVTVGEFCERV